MFALPPQLVRLTVQRSGPSSSHSHFFLKLCALVLAFLFRSMQGSCASRKRNHLECGWDAADESDLFFTKRSVLLNGDNGWEDSFRHRYE